MRSTEVQEERCFDLHRVVDHVTKEFADLLREKQLAQRKVEQDMLYELVGIGYCHASSHDMVTITHGAYESERGS